MGRKLTPEERHIKGLVAQCKALGKPQRVAQQAAAQQAKADRAEVVRNRRVLEVNRNRALMYASDRAYAVRRYSLEFYPPGVKSGPLAPPPDRAEKHASCTAAHADAIRWLDSAQLELDLFDQLHGVVIELVPE